jgi:hypothetical protein
VSGRPRLVLVLELEADQGFALLDVSSHEDELRLRRWLARSPAYAALPALVARLLDGLDALDEERAA